METADFDNPEREEVSSGSQVEANAVGSNFEPCEGMVFESEEAARAYYDEYARRSGFVTRVLSTRKSERDGSLISRGLGCRGIPDNVEIGKGDRRRDGCSVSFQVKRDNLGKWVVKKFVRDHNHSLEVSLPRKRPILDEKDKKIQELNAELRAKKRLSAAYREQLLSIISDVENYNDHLSVKVDSVQNNLKALEATRQETFNHKTLYITVVKNNGTRVWGYSGGRGSGDLCYFPTIASWITGAWEWVTESDT